jgi:O-antigen/teichoic acid export membrane protein
LSPKLELRRLARDSLYNLVRQGWTIVLGLAISILLARGLGKEARGQYTMAILLPEMLVTFLNLGIGAATVYFIGGGQDPPGKAIKNNLLLVTALSLLSIAAGLVVIFTAASWLFPGLPKEYLFLSLCIVPVILLTTALNAVFQGVQDFKRFNAVGMAAQLALLILVLVCVWWLKGKVIGAILAYLGANLLALLLLGVLLWKRFQPEIKNVSWKLSKEYTRKLLAYGMVAHVSNIITFLNYRLDNLILNAAKGTGAVGVYSIAVGVGERFWIPATAIGSVLFPHIASLEGDEQRRKEITPMLSRFVLWLSLAMTAVAFPLLGWVITLFYTSEFIEAIRPLQLLLPGIVLLNTAKILANDIAGRGKPQVNLYQSAIALVVNVAANILLIPHYGVAGAALASTISYSLLAILTIIAYCRIVRVSWRQVIFMQRSDFQYIARYLSQFIPSLKP